MATKFKKGDTVVVNSVLPSGPVEALAMDEDGTVRYRITWIDVEGDEKTRWFNEDVLVAG
jgi:uncharacterized protein YodC (DUF2158 family)